MEVIWKQFITHGLGFLLVLWILGKFAWKPILNMLEERRKKITDEFASIDEEKAKVAELTAEYEGKLKDIDNERRQRLVEAVDEGKKIAEEIKAAAREEAKEAGTKAKDELERDVAKAKVQLKNDMIAMTVSATEKILREKLDDAKHREMISNFIDSVEKA